MLTGKADSSLGRAAARSVAADAARKTAETAALQQFWN